MPMDPPPVKRKTTATNEPYPDRNVRARAESVAPPGRMITLTANQQLDMLLKTLLHLPTNIPFFKEMVSNIYELCDPEGISDETVLREIPALLKEKGADDRKIAATKVMLQKFYNGQHLERIASGIETLEELGHILAVIFDTISASNENLRANPKVAKLKAFNQAQLLKMAQTKPTSVQQSPAQEGMSIRGTVSNGTASKPPALEPKNVARHGNEVDELIAEAAKKSNNNVSEHPAKDSVVNSIETIPSLADKFDTEKLKNGTSGAAVALDGATYGKPSHVGAETADAFIRRTNSDDQSHNMNGIASKLMSQLDTNLRTVLNTSGGTEHKPRAKSVDREPRKEMPRSPLDGRVRGGFSSSHSSPKDHSHPWPYYEHQNHDPREKDHHDTPSDKLGCWFWNFGATGCVKSAFECKYAHEKTYWVAPRNPGGRPIRAKVD